MNNYLIVDIENNNKSGLRKAGHFLYDSIVAIGMKNTNECYSKYIYPNKLKEFKIDEDLLVGHHLQHDLLFLWPLLQDFFKKGGEVWDTQIVEYLLSGQRKNLYSNDNPHPLALRTIARLYGCPKREKYIDNLLFNKIEKLKLLKELCNKEENELKLYQLQEECARLEKYKQVSDLPQEFVIKDVENDVKDTEVVYLNQLKKVNDLKMMSLVRGYMDGLLGMCEIEYNGAFINQQKLQENKKELEKQLIDLENELQNIIKEYWK